MSEYINSVARMVSRIAGLTLFCSFIAGIIYGNVEIPATYSTVSDSKFVWTIVLTWWVEGIIAFGFLLGFAQIIELLDRINNKLNDVEVIKERLNKVS
ncbi:hypothetical protein ACQCN2_03610 [Brevibacillus ginsengisoli]|uniref:hypothetical protein n=1 Tax=Brevibacillus ginsengisoli TaxID=363854 RepID=UPI003CEEEB3D